MVRHGSSAGHRLTWNDVDFESLSTQFDCADWHSNNIDIGPGFEPQLGHRSDVK